MAVKNGKESRSEDDSTKKKHDDEQDAKKKAGGGGKRKTVIDDIFASAASAKKKKKKEEEEEKAKLKEAGGAGDASAGKKKKKQAGPQSGKFVPAEYSSAKDDIDLDGIFPRYKRKKTNEGYALYSEKELRIDQGGGTPLCPFDCNCCF
jgi:hypothetical protein